MKDRTEATQPQLCLRANCPDHRHDATWLRVSPRPRRVYGAATRR